MDGRVNKLLDCSVETVYVCSVANILRSDLALSW